jgi:hypothetical protein
VLEQIEMLGELVVPVLRREFAAVRRPDIPDAPTHEGLLAAAQARAADAEPVEASIATPAAAGSAP